jgi:Nucleotide modification associated domain 2
MYVVDRDFGFAPNPFHGYCTLATCKPVIRKKAEAGDWVMGMGGARLKATGRCLFAMRVTEKLTFNEYWSNPKFIDKKPVRNGSQKMMVGDNIYYYDKATDVWYQADSHHSNADGTVNRYNLDRDTQADSVLVSRHFFYFGREAPVVPKSLLDTIGYKNQRSHRVFDYIKAARLVEWLQKSFREALNQVSGDPFDFDESQKRYSAGTNKVT